MKSIEPGSRSTPASGRNGSGEEAEHLALQCAGGTRRGLADRLPADDFAAGGWVRSTALDWRWSSCNVSVLMGLLLATLVSIIAPAVSGSPTRCMAKGDPGDFMYPHETRIEVRDPHSASKGGYPRRQVSLSGDLLRPGWTGDYKVSQKLDSTYAPEAISSPGALLRLRARVSGEGILSLWEVTRAQTRCLYTWPRALYGGDSKGFELRNVEGQRLVYAIEGQGGRHMFVLVLSEATPPPNSASWLDQVRAERIPGATSGTLVWEVVP